MALPKRLAEAFKSARQRAGLSQVGLAQKAQIDQSTVSLLERARRSPGMEALARLRMVLELSEEFCQEIIKASRRSKPLSSELGRLAALPFRWYEMVDRRQRSLRDREKGMRSQKGGRFIRNQRFGIRPGRRGGRR
ncbi:MAG: helix-turn-helix domain-containing protein [Candidatus Dormibacteraceae bacterium]